MNSVAARSIRKRLTKKELCYIFGLVNNSGRRYSDKLRKELFTDEVLNKLDLSIEEYRKMRTFTFTQSRIIIELFDIQENERLND